jgi:hypothetical protein
MRHLLPARVIFGRAFLFAVLASLFGLGACSRAAPLDPRATAQAFYEFYLQQRMSGLPSPEQTRTLKSLLSNELLSAIERARSEQAEFIGQNPDEKPPWIEGDLFSSLYEGAHSYRVIQVDETPTETRVLIHLEHRDDASAAASPATTEWRDRLLLIQENGRWVIADIEYGGDWDFANKGTLSRTLKPTHPKQKHS